MEMTAPSFPILLEVTVNLRSELQALIKQVEKSEGTTQQGAIRDILTDLFHECDDLGLDADAIIESAFKVVDEENELNGN